MTILCTIGASAVLFALLLCVRHLDRRRERNDAQVNHDPSDWDEDEI